MNLKIYTKLLFTIIICTCWQSISFATGLKSVGSYNLIGLNYKNDCILSFGGMALSKYKKLAVQTGYAYNNFLAFQIGYSYFSDEPNRTGLSIGGVNSTEYYNDHFAHAALGVFYPITTKNSNWGSVLRKEGKWYIPRHILFDLYIGYGKGFNKRLVELTGERDGVVFMNHLRSTAGINFNKWYAQGGFHFAGDVFGGSISGLLGILNFRKITINGVPRDDLFELVDLFKEEATYITYGGQFKVWYCFDAFTVLYSNHVDIIRNNISEKNLYIYYDILNYYLDNYYGEVSVQVNISKLFKKKNEPN